MRRQHGIHQNASTSRWKTPCCHPIKSTALRNALLRQLRARPRSSCSAPTRAATPLMHPILICRWSRTNFPTRPASSCAWTLPSGALAWASTYCSSHVPTSSVAARCLAPWPIGQRRKAGCCMTPSLEEATRLLRLARRDEAALNALLAGRRRCPPLWPCFTRSSPWRRHLRR